METLANLESFVRSAETHSFSAAARRLALTPAAVSRNVAMLERNLGVRLFQRSTRRLTITEAGQRLLRNLAAHLDGVHAAIADVRAGGDEPAGTLRVSVALGFGLEHVLPLLVPLRARYPRVVPDWQFANRPVDLIGEGFDAAIGAGFALAAGVVARALAPAHLVAVAAPRAAAARARLTDPSQLAGLDGIAQRSARTGRIRVWTMRDARGREATAAVTPVIVVDDPAAMCRAAALGLGVAVVSRADALPYFGRGELVRVLPQWWADAGAISVYYPSRALLPAKTRAFVELVTEEFKTRRLARRFHGGSRS